MKYSIALLLMLFPFIVHAEEMLVARFAPPEIEQHPASVENNAVINITPYAQSASVEIIDGGDVDTLKALFPGVCEDDCPDLRRIRERRLANEAKCVASKDIEIIVFTDMIKTNSMHSLIENIEHSKRNITYCSEYFRHATKTIAAIYESITTRGKNRRTYDASVVVSFLVHKDVTDVKNLKTKKYCTDISILSKMEHKIC